MSTSSEMPSTDLMEALMKDPVKKALILQLLTQEKDGFEAYKQREMKKLKHTTPVKRIHKKVHCESPTALQRRRALEQSDSSSSEMSEVPVEHKGPTLPFDQLLKGVKAYVEVKRNDTDRSEGIKTVMKLMGATIRDQFTNDVTHVVFKDGSFTTYQKAKLMKVHLVSVLWLDAIRRNNCRVPEKNYPAFGSKVCDENVSILCSQLQKDYEDIIKEEKRRTTSALPGTSNRTLNKHRRRTVMTPRSSISSYLTAEKSNLLFAEEDREIDEILSGNKANTPDLTSDDSDVGMVDGEISKRVQDSFLNEESRRSVNLKKQISESSGSISLISHIKTKRQTNHDIADMVITPNVNKNDGNEKSKKVLQNSTLQSSAMSSLRMSSDSDRTKSGLGKQNSTASTRSFGLKHKQNYSAITSGTSMSSLRLSDSSDQKQKKPSEDKENISSKDSSTASDRFDDNVTKRSRRPISLSKSETKEKKNVNDRQRSVSSLRSEAESANKAKSRRKSVLLLDSKLEDSFINEEQKSKNNSTSTDRSPASTSKTGNKERASRSRTTVSSSPDSEERSKSNEDKQVRRSTRSFSVASTKTDLEDRRKSHEDKLVRRSTRSSSVASTKTASEDRRKSNEDKQVRRTTRLSSVASDSVNTTKTKNRRSTSDENGSPKKNHSLQSGSGGSGEKTSSKRSKRLPVVNSSRSETEDGNRSDETPTKKLKSETSGVKKRRKLYNPNDVNFSAAVDEEEEREEYLRQKTQKSPGGVFVNPNHVIIPTFQSETNKNKVNNSEGSNWSADSGNIALIEKKMKKKKEKKGTEMVRYSSADEQRELLDLLSKKTEDDDEIRHSQRLTLSLTKPKYCFTSGSSDSQSNASLPITPIKRRSTLDFQTISQTQQRCKLKLDTKRKSSIVCTKLHRHEVTNFENIVKDLGVFFVENQVTDNTTHLVVGESKRTINMLRAIARGCWILRHDWLLKSKEEGMWLPEEDYEATDFSPAVQECRLQRHAFGPKYKMDIFKDCGFVYIAKKTTPKMSDLKELITTCQGRVTTVYRNAEILIGDYMKRNDLTCVTETWVLDSITFNKMKPFKNYLIKSSESPEF